MKSSGDINENGLLIAFIEHIKYWAREEKNSATLYSQIKIKK